MSSSRSTSSSLPSTLTCWPEYLPNSTRSPTFRSGSIRLPSLSRLPGTDRDDVALIRLFGGAFGNHDTRSGFGFLVETLDDDAIVERT
jgi:hypothetical protein